MRLRQEPLLTPCRRQTSTAVAPAAASFKISMISLSADSANNWGGIGAAAGAGTAAVTGGSLATGALLGGAAGAAAGALTDPR